VWLNLIASISARRQASPGELPAFRCYSFRMPKPWLTRRRSRRADKRRRSLSVLASAGRGRSILLRPAVGLGLIQSCEVDLVGLDVRDRPLGGLGTEESKPPRRLVGGVHILLALPEAHREHLALL
jgi:hypothetical protein